MKLNISPKIYLIFLFSIVLFINVNNGIFLKKLQMAN